MGSGDRCDLCRTEIDFNRTARRSNQLFLAGMYDFVVPANTVVVSKLFCRPRVITRLGCHLVWAERDSGPGEWSVSRVSCHVHLHPAGAFHLSRARDLDLIPLLQRRSQNCAREMLPNGGSGSVRDT